LQVVVEKADPGARKRRPGHGQAGPGVLGEDHECEQRAAEHAQAAHGGCALLGGMPRGPVLADVLAELVPAQERDQRRPGDDPEQHRDDARGEDELHVRASTTASRPADLLPLTSTASPGSSTPGTPAAAAAASANHSPPYARLSGPTATTTSTPSCAASRPISSCSSGPAGPSSAISPITATVRRPPAADTRWLSAARIETGFAL